MYFFCGLSTHLQKNSDFLHFCSVSSCGSSKRKLMTAPQLVDFLNKTQRDPRLNEILHPYANPARSKDLISQYEPNKYNAMRGRTHFDFCEILGTYFNRF